MDLLMRCVCYMNTLSRERGGLGGSVEALFPFSACAGEKGRCVSWCQHAMLLLRVRAGWLWWWWCHMPDEGLYFNLKAL